MPPTIIDRAIEIPGTELHAGLFAHAGCVALGCLALAIGVLVYVTDRNASASLLMPAWALTTNGNWFGAVGQWLPSFIHPFAFSLFTASLLSRASPWRYGACAAWCVVNIAFELGQHPDVKTPLAQAIVSGPFPGALQEVFANYFLHGTFDFFDIAAAILGALAAAGVLCLASRSQELRHET
jgi:hypothetical protein